VGIADAADRPVGGFSKGMRQRLGLAVALVGAPELLILDEPLGGLDPAGARLLRDVVRDERDRGAAVFFSSHIMDQVETICDRVGIMHDGRLVAADTIDALHAEAATPATVSVSVDTVTEGVEADLTALDGVSAVTTEDGSIHVECADSATQAEVVARLDAAGVAIRDLDTGAPSLEELFLAVTGGSVTAEGSTE
jgi:ABC-2 type transport system ATP-binding protein